MILGVIAQEGRIPPRGTMVFGVFDDVDTIRTPIVSSGLDQVLYADRVLDLDSVLTGVDLPLALSPDSEVHDLDVIFRIDQVAIDQMLHVVLLYTSNDIIFLPDIRIPGYIIPPFHTADDDVIFPPPLILDRGMLRQTAYHFDPETVFLPTVDAPQTLVPELFEDVDDDFSVPLVRYGIGAVFFLSDDFIPHMVSTSFYRPGLVFDEARPVTPGAKLDSAPTFVTYSNDKFTAVRNLGPNNNVCFGGSDMFVDRGKYYFEVTIVRIGGSNDGIGVRLQTATPSNIGSHLYTTGVFQNQGVIYSNNNAYQYRLGSLWHNDIIGVAIDLDHRRGWFRKNGGRWNGLIYGVDIPTFPVDPEQNLGGVIIAAGLFAPFCIFHGGTSGDEMRFNFGATDYLSEKPGGFDHWRLPSPFPESQSADTFGEAYIGTPATLDATPTAAIISPDGLTVTKTGSMLGTAAGWSASRQNYGKFYFEVTVNSSHGLNDHIGITVQNTNSFQMQTQASIVYCNNGAIYSNAVSTSKSLGRDLVPGDVIGVAVDLAYQTTTHGGSIWFRLNGGRWNGDTTQDADPVTGIGGIKVGGWSYSEYWYPAIGFAGTSSENGDQFTANFGQNPYFSPSPAGYAIWPEKLLEIILPVKAGEAGWTLDDAFPTPFVDLKDKFLVHGESPFHDDVIYGGESYGGNLFFYPNAVFNDVDTIYQAGNYANFGGNLESANVTVSLNDLRATLTTSVNSTGARSVNFQSSGKYYFEIRGNSIRSSDCAGLMNSFATYTNMVSNGTQCVSVFASNGNIYSNNGYASKSLGPLASGNTICFAIDFQFRKAWIRRDGGLWNNDTTADPSLNIAGVNVGAGSFAPAVGFGGGGQLVGDQWTGNFGATAFQFDVPDGFKVGWPGSSEMTLVQVATVVQDNLLELPFPPPNISLYNQVLTHPIAPTLEAAEQVITGTKLASGTAATLDGAATNAALSNGNRTATHTTATSDSGAKSATTKSNGKIYFEFKIGQTTGASDTVGILDNTGAYNNLVIATPINSFCVRLSTGAVYGGNISSGYNIGPVVAGDVLSFAVDLVGVRGWVSKNGGLWNGNATANPATSVNGAIFSARTYVPAVGFGGTGTAIGDNVTINCGPSGYESPSAGVVGFVDWMVIPPSTLASFDGTNSNVNLSNANLTVAHASTANNSGARSQSLKSSGKFYFEVQMTNIHGAFDCVGMMTTAGTFTEFVTNGTNCLAVYKGTGNIYGNNANSLKTLGPIAIGDVISVAVDFTAGVRKAWMRKNGGNWNGLAIGSENPASNLGGVPIAASVAFSPAVGFGGTGTLANDEMTGIFGPSFSFAAPSGFTPWVLMSPPATLDGAATDATVSGGGLIATHTTTATNAGVRSTANKSTGKWYFEATLTSSSANSDGAGILWPSGTFGQFIQFGQNGCGTRKLDGAIYAAGGASGKVLGAIAIGATVEFAFDLTTRMMWVRKNTAGTLSLWNGDALADPATGTAGIAMYAAGSIDAFAPAVFFGAATVIGDQWTINCGQSAFLNTPPTGFTNWQT